MHERIPGFEVPKYLEKLMSKSATKILFNISENIDVFPGLHDEYPCTLLKLKNHLRNYFEKYNFSEQSIERLTFLCFEMDV
ncbi:hypothetical protein NBO_57g0004 [Nosema bombycis CQ1]|uniref:Uncharacterized protein n=1 Tax=Nosema bombycis (strain CQ1 / CVCC 102059) TaxID=578461 RepID=R0KUD2_NOSB1|nr:hypothetical protein NBO_57g0004 [Nosema bombycis CQ1]|eukprot:EOB13827.1 hypothetical protein NBO_57g0004 [Nosema bombycis CQ1]